MLPSRPKWLTCINCGREGSDRWGLTDNLLPGDYEAARAYDYQLRDMRERMTGCRHNSTTVRLHPECSDCGVELPPHHPLAQEVARRVRAMKVDPDSVWVQYHQPAPELDRAEPVAAALPYGGLP
jgi:hypothetical protein